MFTKITPFYIPLSNPANWLSAFYVYDEYSPGACQLASQLCRFCVINQPAILWLYSCNENIMADTWCREGMSTITGVKALNREFRFSSIQKRMYAWKMSDWYNGLSWSQSCTLRLETWLRNHSISCACGESTTFRFKTFCPKTFRPQLKT